MEDLTELVKHNIEIGKERRNDKLLKSFFETQIQDREFTPQTLNVCLSQMNGGIEDIEGVLSFDPKGKPFKLTFEEFQRLVRMPTILHQWILTLSLSELFADSIPVSNKLDPLPEVSRFSCEQIKCIWNRLSIELELLFCEGVQKLRESYDALEKLDNQEKCSKFHFEDCQEMEVGDADDYHKGLENRIGHPHLEFFKAMETEHQVENLELRPMSSKQAPSNPFREWNLVARRKGVTEAEFEDILSREFPGVGMGEKFGGRQIPDVLQLVQSPSNAEAQLLEVEVISLILYTGPMFQVYNLVLRRWPLADYQRLRTLDRLFITSVHVIVSAVQKLSRAVRIPDGTLLYRGLGGRADLPRGFFHADARGRRGFAEWAFMSTTAERKVAVYYSRREGRQRATVMSFRTGSVDRGACIEEFSQFPHEREFLWLPLSFLQPDGLASVEATQAGGVLSVVPVRVTANLKGSTLEETLERRKTAHLAGFRYLIEELGPALRQLASQAAAAAAAGGEATKKFDQGDTRELIEAIVGECQGRRAGHQALAAAGFADAFDFARVNLEMTEARRFAESKLRLWLEDGDIFRYLIRRPLRESHRLLVSLRLDRIRLRAAAAAAAAGDAGGESRAGEALEVCRLKGLVRSGVDEVNELGEPVLVQAASDDASPNALRLLVLARAAVDAVTPEGESAALRAAQYGHADCLRALLEARADANLCNAQGQSPAYLAARNGYPDCVRALLAAGADHSLRKRDGGGQAMHAAAWGNHPSCLALLMEARAAVDSPEDAGKTPLFVAAGWGNRASVEALLAARADPDAPVHSGAGPLHIAAEYGRRDCLPLLCAGGALVNKADGAGRTALHVAAAAGKADCVAALLGLGADAGLPAADGRDALTLAEEARRPECAAVLRGVRVREAPGLTGQLQAGGPQPPH